MRNTRFSLVVVLLLSLVMGACADNDPTAPEVEKTEEVQLMLQPFSAETQQVSIEQEGSYTNTMVIYTKRGNYPTVTVTSSSDAVRIRSAEWMVKEDPNCPTCERVRAILRVEYSTTRYCNATITATSMSNPKDQSQFYVEVRNPVRVDLKVNGSDGPLNIAYGALLSYRWNVVGATACALSSSTGFLSGVSTGGQFNDVWTGDILYPDFSRPLTVTVTCTDGQHTASDAVTIRLQ